MLLKYVYVLTCCCANLFLFRPFAVLSCSNLFWPAVFLTWLKRRMAHHDQRSEKERGRFVFETWIVITQDNELVEASSKLLIHETVWSLLLYSKMWCWDIDFRGRKNRRRGIEPFMFIIHQRTYNATYTHIHHTHKKWLELWYLKITMLVEGLSHVSMKGYHHCSYIQRWASRDHVMLRYRILVFLMINWRIKL